jgi:peptidoglycan/xylan/chitin deacetylase (PgdA/CDA1 family)
VVAVLESAWDLIMSDDDRVVVTTDRVVNLTFHGVGPCPRAVDDGEAAVWISTAEYEQVLDAAVGRPEVRLSFDDGNLSDIEIALPRLQERGLTATFFVCAGLLGEAYRLADSQLKELLAGGMSIGSHGWAHRSWRGMSADETAREIVAAPRQLADICGTAVSTVAVPFGHYDRIVLRDLKHAGMTRIYTSDGGPASAGAWLQARSSIHRGVTPDGIAALLDPDRSLGDTATRKAKQLIKRWR